jgi:hypothetical protein
MGILRWGVVSVVAIKQDTIRWNDLDGYFKTEPYRLNLRNLLAGTWTG